MNDWPTWLNFLTFLFLPVAVVFGPLFWILYFRKDKK